MTSEIATYLKYVNLQMAAEALYEQKGLPAGSKYSGPVEASVLMAGNERSSKFTQAQTEEFANDWKVVEHISNTTTGFSGTLFQALRTDESRGISAGEFVLCFRSTEFADDAARDNQATNVMEIKAEGWAFGQIADMEKWLSELKASGKIANDKQISVTGYSLGGHLATAFNLLHKNDTTTAGEPLIASTYTFNGAGVGEVINGKSLAQVVSDFKTHRVSGSNTDLFTDADVLARYGSLQSMFKEGADISLGQVDAALQGVDLLILGKQGAAKVQATQLHAAMTRIRSVVYEAERVIAGIASGAAGSNSALHVDLANIAAVGLDYQLAVLRVGQNTAGYRTDPLSGGIDAYAGRNPAPGGALNNFYDLYGAIPPSAVANSQLHYGRAVPIFVEDQPLFRGAVMEDVGTTTLKAGEVKLLVDNFGLNDFGDTHSLVLIVDSLSVQNTLAQLDPTLTAGRMSALFKAVSNLKADAQHLTQGKADGDTLESLVNALADTLGLGWTGEARLEGDPSGNTWARLEDQNGYSGRTTFHQQLKQLTESSAYKSLRGKVTLQEVGSTSGSFATLARTRTSFADIAALQTLAPFVLKPVGATGEAALDSLWRSGRWGESYSAWLQDKSLVSLGKSATSYTDEWISDRAEMLRWQVARNSVDIDQLRVPGMTESFLYRDVATATSFSVSNTNSADPQSLYARRVTFGGSANDELGGADRDDRLYGGAGADTLMGGKGDDYLQGDAGNDTLEGGAGNDTLAGGTGTDIYRFEGTFGKDTLRDSDGLGSIVLDEQTLAGGAGNGKRNTWCGEDAAGNRVDYILQDDATSATGKTLLICRQGDSAQTITLRDFDVDQARSQGGYLGIRLQGPRLVLQQAGGGNPFADPDFEAEQGASRIEEGGAAGYVLYLDQAAAAGDTLTLSLSALADKFQLLHGGTSMPAAGAVIILAEGQTEIHFSLAQQGEISSNGSAQLSATYRSGSVTADSNAWDLTVEDAGELARVYLGDQRPALSEHGLYDWNSVHWAPDGTLEGGVVDAGFNDVLIGQADNNRIEGFGGNDALDGAGGNDVVDGGEGDDLLAGGAGSDLIRGGSGNDWIMSAHTLGIQARRSPEQTWNPPWGTTTWIKGNTWGVYESDNAYVLEGGASLTPDDQADVVYAGDGDDYVIGGRGDDLLNGEAGDDILWGNGGADVLVGSAGDDSLMGDGLTEAGLLNSTPEALHGNDVLDGGDGNDHLLGDGGDDALYGGAGEDSLRGDRPESELAGTAHGEDYLDGQDGNDVLLGGGKGDTLYGGAGNDRMWGDDENEDQLSGAFHGSDFLDGEAGDDQLVGGGADDTLIGAAGADLLFGDDREANLAGRFHGADMLDGGAGDDTLIGGGGNDTLFGGKDDDILFGDDQGQKLLAAEFHGNDELDGEEGDDTLIGGGKDDVLLGGAGNDFLRGDDVMEQLAAQWHGNDLLDGGDGDDILLGDGGDDVLRGGAGDDWLAGEDQTSTDAATRLTGDDQLDGGDGADTLLGGAGDDALAGGSGNDSLYGGAGNDTLDGGAGSDWMSGGAGDDIFRVVLSDGDTVGDFGRGTDRIVLQGALPQDLTVTAAGATLYLQGSNGTLVLENCLRNGNTQAGIEFADGTVWRRSDLISRLNLGIPDQAWSDDAELLVAQPAGGYLVGDIGSSVMVGSEGSDFFEDLGGDDFFYGGAGSDVLHGENGNDLLDGGTGDDVLLGGPGSDLLLGGEGNDVLVAAGQTSHVQTYDDPSAEVDILDGGPGNDDLIGGWGGTGGDHNIYLFGYGDGRDTIRNGGKTNDVIRFKPGVSPEDLVVFINQGRVFYWLSAADQMSEFQSLWQVGRIEFADGTVWGHAEIDARAKGTALELTGPNELQLYGHVGRAFQMDLPQDLLAPGSRSGGVSYAVSGPPGITIDPHTGSISATSDLFSDFWGEPVITIMATDELGARQYIGVEVRLQWPNYGSSETSVIVGTRDADWLWTFGGDDVVYGGAGSDEYVFRPGDGRDIIEEGDPLAIADLDVVTFQGSLKPADVAVRREGADLVLAYGAGDSVTVRRWFESESNRIEEVRFADGTVWNVVELQALAEGRRPIVGTLGNDTLNGTSGNDTLEGLAGNDTLDGKAGADVTAGGAGNDVHVVDNPLDTPLENADEGIDTVKSTVSWTLGANIEHLWLTGLANIDATGNELANVLTANAGNNVLDGASGIDTASYHYADAAVTVSLAATGAQATGGSGWDTLLNIERLLGSRFDDRLTGNAAANMLDGGLGNDTLIGGAGDDTYVVDSAGDTVVELANEGIDTVRTTVTHTLAANVENLMLNSTAAIDGTGNALDNVLYAGAGNNVLDGRGGSDYASYIYAGSAVNVSLAATGAQATGGSGFDTLWNIENLYGSNYDDVLIGSPIANMLNGGIGRDTLRGGAGNDVYYVDNSADVVVELANEGTDLVQSTLSYALPTNVENLSLTGTAAIDATGNDLDNLLTGNAANNTLSGGAGNDTLSGGAGNDTLNGGAGADTLRGGAGNDTYRYRSGDGNDTVSEAGGDDTVELLDLNPNDVRIVEGLNGNPDHIVDALTGYSITLDLNLASPGWSADGTQVEHLRFADGTVWNSEQMRAAAELERSVGLMVQAMATFSVPVPGLVTSTALNDPSRLAPMLAASWG